MQYLHFLVFVLVYFLFFLRVFLFCASCRNAEVCLAPFAIYSNEIKPISILIFVLFLSLPVSHSLFLTLSMQPDWRSRRAALLIVSIICEGVRDCLYVHLKTLVPTIISSISDPHPRVRCVVLQSNSSISALYLLS